MQHESGADQSMDQSSMSYLEFVIAQLQQPDAFLERREVTPSPIPAPETAPEHTHTLTLGHADVDRPIG